MILPFVLGIYLLLIYAMFFQYDRCLLEQDVAVLAMRGAIAGKDGGEEAVESVRREANRLDGERFLMFAEGEAEAVSQRGALCVTQEGELTAPFSLIRGWEEIGDFGTSARSSDRYLNPARVIRACRKWIREKEDENAADGVYQEPEL